MITAYLYETEMNDKEMAEKIYKEVINSYPDSQKKLRWQKSFNVSERNARSVK